MNNIQHLKSFNKNLDKLARQEIHLHTKTWPIFKVYIHIGVIFGIFLSIILTSTLELSIIIMGLIAATVIIAVIIRIMFTKIFTGDEHSAFYHEFILVMFTSIILLWLLNQPILPYLDIIVIALGSIQVIGRIGCLMAGCCHGRPFHWGVCYRKEHAETGFTPSFIGVRFFPVQLIESLWVFCIVLIGIFYILSSKPQGSALAWYGIAYGMGRFYIEFLRGDERPYYWGFSQPQWISLILMITIVWGESRGILPYQSWHFAATTLVVLPMISLAVKRRFGNSVKYKLLHPYHIKEIAEAVQQLSRFSEENSVQDKEDKRTFSIPMAHTSLGVRISASKIANESENLHFYALSSQNGMLTEEAVQILKDLILKLKYPSASAKITKGNQGVFHLLIQPLENEV
jgi:hypothetical protein